MDADEDKKQKTKKRFTKTDKMSMKQTGRKNQAMRQLDRFWRARSDGDETTTRWLVS